MTEDSTDGISALPHGERYRGFRVSIRCEGQSFIARIMTTLSAASVKPLKVLEIHEQDIASSVIDPQCALENAKLAIDQLYDQEKAAVERSLAEETAKLPAWVSDEEFLKGRGKS